MIYKVFKDLKLSRLGMGNMRLPTIGDPMTGPIQEDKAQEIIDHVYKSGVNYFDTAYMYHGGNSEKFLGRALKKYQRGSYYLADKLFGFLVAGGRKPADIFEEQLQRCGTDYFDFYLLHDVCEATVDIFNDPGHAIVPYLLEQKAKGRIRHLGFSSHAKPGVLKEFLDKWDCFEFAQIQLNYLDWTLQDAKRQYELLTEKGLPIIVMEPVRGGRLAALSPELDAKLLAARPDKNVASWAFRWLQGLPNVQLVLSGMTRLEQAVDNVATFAKEEPLTAAESAVLADVVEKLKGKINVPCTGCHYCDGCPQGLHIPDLVASCNEFCVEPGPVARLMTFNIPEGLRPSACVACGLCAEKCPQHIDIPGVMKKFAEGIAKTNERK